MSTEQAHVRPAAVEDLEAIAGIFARYVVESVATFEEVPPTVAHWRAGQHWRVHVGRIP